MWKYARRLAEAPTLRHVPGKQLKRDGSRCAAASSESLGQSPSPNPCGNDEDWEAMGGIAWRFGRWFVGGLECWC